MLGDGESSAVSRRSSRRWRRPGDRIDRRRALAALGLPLLALAGWRELAADDLTASAAVRPATASQTGDETLIVTCSRDRHLAIVNPNTGLVELVEAGAAPHGLALHPDGRAFVATAEGVAVVDLVQRQRLALVPYSVDVGPPRFGEYRPGGMGIAVTPDGSRVAVGVHRPSGPSILDVLDTGSLAIVTSVVVGIRPFQVVAAADSRHIYSIDHDSYTVTVVDLDSGSARPLAAQPLGRGAFDKPHYAALRRDGTRGIL